MTGIIFSTKRTDLNPSTRIFAVDKDAWLDYMEENLNNNEQEAILYD